MNELTPRIYVACLAAYNNGQLHGAWIDADQSADAIHEAIRAMLASSPIPGAEEWAIHDVRRHYCDECELTRSRCECEAVE